MAGLFTGDQIVQIMAVILTAMCGYITWFLKRRTEHQSTTEKAICIILRGMLRQMYRDNAEDKKMTEEEYNEAIAIYDVYHKLGGNGAGTQIIETIKKWEVE